MADPSVVDALNTLRDLFNNVGHSPTCQWGECPCREFDTALAVVETALADLRRERDQADDALQSLAADHYFARAEAAEARAVAAEAERDTLRQALESTVAYIESSETDKPGWQGPNQYAQLVLSIARAVLAGEEPT